MANCPKCISKEIEHIKSIGIFKVYICKKCNFKFAKEEERPKEDCKYHDYGDTAPRTYGAFCSLKIECLRMNTCLNCKEYEKR